MRRRGDLSDDDPGPDLEGGAYQPSEHPAPPGADSELQPLGGVRDVRGGVRAVRGAPRPGPGRSPRGGPEDPRDRGNPAAGGAREGRRGELDRVPVARVHERARTDEADQERPRVQPPGRVPEVRDRPRRVLRVRVTSRPCGR